ncbi:THAP domain-containing [Labeo rohita]|uniref:THAP domain-containing n=1 Tax=Labeo rohita TaxID=84645 RepID=A0A498P3E1_LABRO|nr:THAP domain-containing [Labeo rohita]
MRERHIEDVVYSSVRQCHRTAAAECSLTLKIRALKSQQKTCQAVDFKTGFNTNILSTMRKAMETTKPIDKLCAIVTDEMSLKEAVHYNEVADRVERFENFGKVSWSSKTDFTSKHKVLTDKTNKENRN